MELKIINSEEEFIALKEKWNKIVSRMCDSTPFQSWEWNYFWWKEIENQIPEILIMEAFEERQTYGFAPLIIKNNKISFIGDKHFDYGMFICAEQKREIIELYLKKIKEICHDKNLTLFLQCIPEKGDQLALFREEVAINKKATLRRQVDTANIHLSEYQNFETYLKAISRSLRKKAIKPCKKADLKFKIESYSKELWEDILEIYADRQEDRVGVSTLEWAKPIVKNMSEQGLMKISTLSYQEKRVAYLIFFELNKCDYVWLTAFRKTENYQLGHYIRYCLIERAYENELKGVDMMRGAYAYKRQWDCNVSTNYEFIIFRNRFFKVGYLLIKKCRKLVRDFIYNNEFWFSLYKKHSKKG